MTGEGHFEPAAKSRAMNSGYYRLRRILDRGEDFRQARRHRRLAEFGDISTSNKGTAFTAQHHGFGCIFLRGIDCVQDTLAYRL